MNRLNILILLIMPFTAFGQQPILRKTALGISFMPNVSYRTLNYHEPNEMASVIRNSEETAKFSYVVGLNIKYRINKKLTLQSGILYSNQGYQTKFSSLDWAVQNNGYPNQSKTIFNFNQIELPLNLNYILTETNHFSFYGIIGLSPTVFISRQVAVISKYTNGETLSQSSTKYVGYSRFNLSANIGIGIVCKISNKFSILAEPKFQHSINSIAVNPNAKEYLYNVGIDFKCYYSFFKKRKTE